MQMCVKLRMDEAIFLKIDAFNLSINFSRPLVKISLLMSGNQYKYIKTLKIVRQ